MGYDLHVIRGDEWSDANRPKIPIEQWLELVDTDPTLELRNLTTATTPNGETVEYRTEGLAVWTGSGTLAEIPFDFRDGSVVVKNPDERTIAKMVEIAAYLEARVQGDEGEFYEQMPIAEPNPPSRLWPFRRRRSGRAGCSMT